MDQDKLVSTISKLATKVGNLSIDVAMLQSELEVALEENKMLKEKIQELEAK